MPGALPSLHPMCFAALFSVKNLRSEFPGPFREDAVLLFMQEINNQPHHLQLSVRKNKQVEARVEFYHSATNINSKTKRRLFNSVTLIDYVN